MWIEDTFGVTARPYFRPPYGALDDRTTALLGDLGYTRVLLWSGSLDDAVPTTGPAVLAAAKAAFVPGAVVLGHGNHPAVVEVLPQLLALLTERRLVPTTLDEALGTSRLTG